MRSAPARGSLGLGLEAVNEETIEAAPVGLDADLEAGGEGLLDPRDELPRSFVAQRRANGIGEMEVVEAQQAFVRRRLRLDRDAGPQQRIADMRRDPHPRLNRRFACKRVPFERTPGSAVQIDPNGSRYCSHAPACVRERLVSIGPLE